MQGFTCPGCNANYVGNTEITLYEKSVELAWKEKSSTIKNHLHHLQKLTYLVLDCQITAISDQIAIKVLVSIQLLITSQSL